MSENIALSVSVSKMKVGLFFHM